MTELYPIKFEPILKEKVWGGNKLVNHFGKKTGNNLPVGESWEISGLPDDESIVANGFLAGNNLNEILEVYMGDLAGDSVYEKFGDEFPLLIKFIDANDNLSVQVHPGDDLAAELHHAYGKSEMWYVLSAQEGSVIYCGFKNGTDKAKYKAALETGTLPDILNGIRAKAGDTFWLPAGTIHAIGSGIVLAEIQQASDITYRVFDWNRAGTDGQPRELHTDLAERAIDFSSTGGKAELPIPAPNSTNPLVKSEYFTTNLLSLNSSLIRDYNLLDSFVIFICTGGESVLHWEHGTETVVRGDTVLIPASVRDITLEPKPSCTLLEVYINLNTTSN
jgi:mannose-6-phosphate isomerase